MDLDAFGDNVVVCAFSLHRYAGRSRVQSILVSLALSDCQSGPFLKALLNRNRGTYHLSRFYVFFKRMSAIW